MSYYPKNSTGGMRLDGINLVEPFLNDKKNRFSENTRSSYKTDMKQFFEVYNKGIEEIEEDDVEDYKIYMLNRNKNPKTVNRKLASLKKFIKYINRNYEILGLKNMINIEVDFLNIQKQQFLKDLLLKSDFNRIVRAAERENDYRAIALFYTLYLTGARISEGIQLKVDDAGRETKFIKGKGKKYRELFIPSFLNIKFEHYLLDRGHAPGSYMFINEQNDNCIDRHKVDRIIKYYAGQARVKKEKAHAHNFRHLYGFTLANKGVSIDKIAELMGHSDINMTKIYTMGTKEDLMRIVEDIA